MSTKTDSLRELYLDVAEDETVTEHQREEPSRDPVGVDDADLERSLATALDDGLDDAVDGAELQVDVGE